MTDLRVRITAVQPLSEHWVRLDFADGAVHEVDLGGLLAEGGIFTPIYTDRSIFEAVEVDDFDTLVWPGEVDLDPWVLRGLEAPAGRGALPRRVVVPA
jgi:hypothetical protein